jgi:hypothetical protein
MKARALIDSCEPYLKDGETPADGLARNRSDIDALLTLLATERRKVCDLEAEIASLRACEPKKDSQSIRSDRISESTIARMAGNIAGAFIVQQQCDETIVARNAVAVARAIADEVRRTGAESR